MTLIIGIEDPENDRAILASDSGAWRGDREDLLPSPKLWRMGKWLFGAAGDWGDVQFAQGITVDQGLLSFSREAAERVAFDHACKLERAFAERYDTRCRADEDCKRQFPAVLAGYDSWLWYLGAGAATRIARGHQAIGCADYGEGALAALALCGPRSALDRAHTAMQAVASMTRLVRGPFYWWDTKGAGGTWGGP